MTSEKEKALKKAYKKLIEASLGNSGVKTGEDLVDDKLMAYGSAIDEKLFSANDYRELIKRQQEQGSGIEMSFVETPVFQKSISEDLALFVSEFVVSLIIAGNKTEMFLRLSVLLEYKNGRWITIHFHGSKPDVASQNDTWHVNEWQTKNELLQKLVDEKTADLELKNREAAIEIALEKVRSRSLAMKKSDEVASVAVSVFEGLKNLQVELDAANILFFSDSSNDIECWTATEQKITRGIRLPYEVLPLEDLHQAKLSGQEHCTFSYSGEAKNTLFNYLLERTDFRHTSEDRKKILRTSKVFTMSVAIEKNIALQINSYSKTEFSEGDNKIIKRFARVFEQAYTRFLDLQKAEAQAREAQIETALEKVRSTSLAMHHSNELEQVVASLFKRLTELGLFFDGALIFIFQKELRHIRLWIATNQLPAPFQIDLPHDDEIKNNEIIKDLWNAIETGEHIFNKSYSGGAKDEYFRYVTRYNQSKIPESVREIQLKADAWTASFAAEKNSMIGFDNWFGVNIKKEDFEILLRFSKVFEQSYTRFLDLQKAETLAREAQIEASLERVRSRAMAMHKSEELKEGGELLWNELHKLGIESLSSGYVIIEEAKKIGWTYAPNPATGKIGQPLGIHSTTKEMLAVLASWKKQELVHVVEMDEQETITHQTFVAEQSFSTDGKISRWITAEQLIALSPKRLFLHSFNFIQGYLMVLHGNRLNDEQIDLLLRFTKVFQQTYTRFLDLQKAEAQATEAKIEAALERVRSSSMAMHKSQDLNDVIKVMTDQCLQVGLNLHNATFARVLPDRSWNLWLSTPGQAYPAEVYVPYLDHRIFNTLSDDPGNKRGFITQEFSFDEKNEFFKHFLQNTVAKNISEERKQYLLTSKGFARTALIIKDIWFTLANYDGVPFSEEENLLIKRFAHVFEQAYTRFLDLEKAEAQAREALLEAALERVRGKAMAMHNSDDLISTASQIFTELKKLDIVSIRSGVGLLSKENRKAKLYLAASSADDISLRLSGWIMLDEHPILATMYDRWILNEDYFPTLKGELLRSYYEKLSLTFYLPQEQSEGYEQHGYFLPFSEGLFYGWAEKPYSEQAIKILHRFKAIVDLTFRRYFELQKSEANARDAVRRASLDRVRAEIASMRTTKDLERITPLIWNELTILGVPFVRCGVFIMDEGQQQIHTFLSTPDGKAIASFNTSFSSESPIADALPHWRKKEIYKTHWDEKAFLEQAKSLIEQGVISSPEKYLTENRPTSLELHFLPFLQGMLYVGNVEPLIDEHLELVQSVADAFSTAYARYEDFNKLESTKAEIEKTLSELKLAQAQLVQSEKMASLGELTAGIAHEIQNPLNFVNNFSEVSRELLDEMKTALDKGNTEEVRTLAADVIENLTKINHHGKRADAIVKGMLQHSRKSSDQKELTDLNALCDEYLRLAYHGLRAKDKSFNAKFETDFNSTLPKVNVVAQDIGRVVLNLITNAFYAVNEKAKQNISGYEPMVIVSTHYSLSPGAGEAIITVRDNGNGIPEKIREKIFQPFFTTKPTGQGTGLGLSLSYDIVKAHGGELKVTTKEGESSEFTIYLSKNQRQA
jgi:signal transduction histidine kinase